MKRFLYFCILLALSCDFVYCQEVKKLSEVIEFGNNPGNLKMFVHSTIHQGKAKTPLVVVLHGCGENAEAVAKLTGWNKLADLNDFIVVYPQQKIVNNPNLCFNWFLNKDIEKGKGECESIFEMTTYAKKNYAIDSSRIYITGLSAGAAMSLVMTATHPELFKCGAIFAGGAYKIVTNPKDGFSGMLGKKYIPKEKLIKDVKDQNPDYKGQYPSIIVYQGLNDPIVNCKSTKYIINQWTGVNRSDTIPDKTEKAFMQIKDITRTEYKDSSGRTTLTYYEVNNLGHRLLIKPGAKENEGGQTGIFGLDKGYHSTYQTAKEFGIIKK